MSTGFWMAFGLGLLVGFVVASLVTSAVWSWLTSRRRPVA